MLYGKIIFAVDLLIKLFRVIITNADTGSLNSIHTLFDKYLDYMLAKSEPIQMVPNVQTY